MRKLLFFSMVLLFPIYLAYAEDVVMSTDQQTYYFTIGEKALIPVNIENNSGEEISGIFQYTVTQEIRQGNAQISSTNSNTSTLTLEEGEKILSLDFGSFNSPSTITANLMFNYNNGSEMNIFLGPIEIIFVEDSSQMNSYSKSLQSSSQQTNSANNQPSSQQSLQQRLNEMLNQSPLIQDPQQRLQNNQLSQDSSSLKKEIQEQLENENQMQQEFEKNIISKEEFQRLHQQMLDEGYELKQGSLSPTTNSTGSFEAIYENQNGKWGKIEGNMNNGTLTNIEKHTQLEQENLLSKLRNHPAFHEFEAQLSKEGFLEQNVSISTESGITSIDIEYQNRELQTATIIGDFVGDELKEIKIDRPDSNLFDILPFLIIALIAITIAFLLIKLRTKRPVPKREEPKIVAQKFDYVSEAEMLLEKSKTDFQNQLFKDAYGKLGQAIRLFLSYKLGLRKEITNEELLKYLNETQYPVNEIQKCLDKSTLVEFAKNSPDKNEFENMITLTESLIKN